MAVFQCKMCGGALDINEGQNIAICPYCGSKQTIPKLDNGKVAKILERANSLRLAGEYDKAIAEYDKILETNEVIDAEIYWNIVLCKYGVVYVTDPSTGLKVPTINRTQVTPVLLDEDYQKTIELADPTTRQMYEEEAKVIDNIQEGILAVSRNEEPFDIFICYKETDENGERTRDSVNANEIYHYLTDEGYKVFFSRITLEDKVGKYEPYIYAALNSAKIMVVIGSKKEYFEAPWVKNEWMRYINIIKKDPASRKSVIPCYKDMDPYELPREFSYYQAQDMNKLGFIPDLIRGIKKILPKEVPGQQQVANAGMQGNVATGQNQATPVIKKAKIFIEQRDYANAKRNLDVAFDLDPENWEIYLCNLLMDYNLGNESDLKNLNNTFDSNYNYKKIIEFADEPNANRIKSYNDFIIERLANENAEQLYRNADGLAQFKTDNDKLNDAQNLYRRISDFKDAGDKAKKCVELIYSNILNDYDNSKDIGRLEKAKKDLVYIDTQMDVSELSDNINKKIAYVKGLNIRDSAFANIPAIDEHIRLLNTMRDFDGVSDLIYDLEAKKKQIDRNVKKAKRITFFTGFAAVFVVCVLLMISFVTGAFVSNGLRPITPKDGPNKGRKVYQFKVNGEAKQSGNVDNKYAIINGIVALDAWFTSGDKYYYYDKDGQKVTNKMIPIDGKYYAFHENGAAYANEFYDDMYFNQDRERVSNRLQEIGGKMYYLGIDGRKEKNSQYPCNSEMALIGSQQIDKKWYNFGDDGRMIKNMMLTTASGTEYYDENGVKAIDREIKYNGQRYYFNQAGDLVTNQIVKDKYYAKGDGSLAANEVVSINGKQYYYMEDGTRAKSNTAGYVIEADGTLASGNKGGVFYLGGKPYTGEHSGNYYTNGVIVKNRWEGDYYLGSNGYPLTNQWVGDYYVGADGKYLRNTQIQLGNDLWTFDSAGKGTKQVLTTYQQPSDDANTGGSGNDDLTIALVLGTPDTKTVNGCKISYRSIDGAHAATEERQEIADAIFSASGEIESEAMHYLETELAEHASTPKQITLSRYEVLRATRKQASVRAIFSVKTKSGKNQNNKHLNIKVDLDSGNCEVTNKPTVNLE